MQPLSGQCPSPSWSRTAGLWTDKAQQIFTSSPSFSAPERTRQLGSLYVSREHSYINITCA